MEHLPTMSIFRSLIVATLTCFMFSFNQVSAQSVVVSIPPIHSLASQLLDQVDTPHLLLKGIISPHDFTLKPSQRQLVQNADLVVWVGENLEGALAKLVSNHARAAFGIHQVEEKLNLMPFGEDGHDHHDHHGHDHFGLDPHFWLSPDRAIIFSQGLAEQLIQVYPKHRVQIQQNLSALEIQLEELKKGVSATLAPVHTTPYLVFHNAYRYFEVDFSMNNVGAVAVNPEQGISAKQMLAVRKQIKKNNAKCIFSEPQFSDKLVNKLAAATGAKTGSLDPLGHQIEPGKKMYSELITRMANNFESCLAGS